MKHKRVQVALIKFWLIKSALHSQYIFCVCHMYVHVPIKECILYLEVICMYMHVVHVDINCLQRTLYGVTCTSWLVIPLLPCSHFDKPRHVRKNLFIMSILTASRDVGTTLQWFHQHTDVRLSSHGTNSFLSDLVHQGRIQTFAKEGANIK